MFFANGYGYVDDSQEPWKSSSAPHLAIFMPTMTADIGSPNAGGLRAGEIGAGPRSGLDAYWFNVYSGDFGCDQFSDNPSDTCTIVAKGYKYDPSTKAEAASPYVYKEYTIPPCDNLHQCDLTHIDFEGNFQGITGLQLEAIVGNVNQRIFLMDNFNMGWYNNTCAAGMQRMSSKK